MQILNNPVVVGNWVIAKLPELSKRTFIGRMDAFSALGYIYDGRMVLGVLFSDHSTIFRGIQVHMAMDMPAGFPPAYLRAYFGHAMEYVFGQLKCVRVTANVPKRHEKMRKMIKALGFVEEGCLKHGFLVDDCIIYGLTKKNAQRWLLHHEKNPLSLS